MQKDIVCENVRTLVAAHKEKTGDNLKQLAARLADTDNDKEQIYLWLRRLHSQGIRQKDKRTVQRLEKLASVLGVEVEDFWKPPQITAEALMRSMEKDYPKQWTLLLAWETANDRGEKVASLVASFLAHHCPRFSGTSIKQTLMIRDATKDLDSQLAKEIETNLCIVSRLRQPEIWELVQQSRKLD